MTRTTRSLLALALGAVLLLAACGSSGSGKTVGTGTAAIGPSATTSTTAAGGGGRYGTKPPSASTTTAAPSGTATVSMTTTKLGLTLVDSNGHTLYEYMPDPKGSSTCTGACSTLWPPLTAPGTTVTVGAHLTASLFSVIAGPSGSHIVAIAGHALYRFSGDTQAGQTNGQGIGGFWHAAGPLGNTM